MARTGKSVLFIRRLSGSDLGWFAEPRDNGAVASKQRAININASLIAQILTPTDIESGGVYLYAQCAHPKCKDARERILSKVGKNWRLGGPKVPGVVFRDIQEGDFLVCQITLTQDQPYPAVWSVVMASESPADHVAFANKYAAALSDRMLLISAEEMTAPIFLALLSESVSAPEGDTMPLPARRHRRRLSVKERLQQPHIIQEMMKTALSLSAKAQQDFLALLEQVAAAIREMLVSEELIQSVEIDHSTLWSEVSGKPLAFVDGGMANIGSLGAEPVAIRVGSYLVTPGRQDAGRECFRIEKQLVDELFETRPGSGIFDDGFDDVGKLREAARISLEAAGSLATLEHSPVPEMVFLHGSLVNPVSPYALDGFPDFTESGLQRLLPPPEHSRTGRDRNFVSVYLRQLEMLRDSHSVVCGVVERASSSRMVTAGLIERLKSTPSSPGAAALEALMQRIVEYRLTDAVLFHSILNEGEYLIPVEVDRNDLRRAPAAWQDLIQRYPKPLVTYVGLGEMALPVRCEFFEEPATDVELPIRVIIHSCRLMPHYAFPAGLDIVDKFAKVPDWMSRPINSALAVQILKKAMQSGNPAMLAEAKRLICGTTRDWMMRPNYLR